MRELRQRAEPILKIVCLILAAVVLYQLAGIFIRWNPFRGVVVPQVPSLTAGTNAPAGGGHGANQSSPVASQGTNNLAPVAKTNAAFKTDGATTNSNSKPMAAVESNSVAPVDSAIAKTNGATILAVNVVTNVGPPNLGMAIIATNKGTNFSSTTNSPGINAATRPKSEMKAARMMPGPDMGGMGFNPFGGPPGKRGADLPPAMQTRISRIVDSEILGPVMRPLPMGLLGIAGEFAFLRSANGQTGLVKEGDSLGDLKLLRIGINRVLVEQDGQKQELMIFSGYGGDSLLPKQKDTPDENEHP